MKNRNSFVIIALLLIIISAIAYYIHYLFFHDLHHILIYLVGDIAFLPLEVLIVGLVIERILAKREADERIQKLNMVVGAFFSEVGRPLAGTLLNATPSRDEIIAKLHVSGKWEAKDYNEARHYIEKESSISFDKIDLEQLRSFLVSKRAFMLRLIENPNLMEHEKFTDLLLASFHLMEELESRPLLDNLPRNDISHIKADIQRAFLNLAVEWLDYMQHLKANYPFLYSHYLRISPYQLKPSAIIE
jgi:hypothetical protein